MILLNEDEEAELGRSSHKQIMKMYSSYNNPELLNYVTDLGEKLAAISHRKELIYHWNVLDTPQVNAFAVPGGIIGVHTGLFEYAETEDQFASVMAHELAHRNIRVNAIAPGPTDTDALNNQVPEEFKAPLVQSLAIKRLGTPDDHAGPVLFLLSDEAKWITGHVLAVDGGQITRI